MIVEQSLFWYNKMIVLQPFFEQRRIDVRRLNEKGNMNERIDVVLHRFRSRMS